MKATDLPEGTVLAARYRVERQLGQGGMGSVYLVRHVRTQERLALKVLHASLATDPKAIERFRAEAQAPARIDSDQVARVVDADVAPELDGAPFLVMEYLRGRDLGQLLVERGRLTAPEVVDLLGQAARALDKAHALGIVHRDLKPENLFLAERDDHTTSLKVLDFGVAKLVAAGGGTSTGQVLGTPLYMAPEQLTHNALVGPRTDVWAVGLIAFRLLTGRYYWTFTTLEELLALVTTRPMLPPSAAGADLGPAFDAWFQRCCARSIDQRFASVGEAVAALGLALGVKSDASRVDAYAVTGLAPAATVPPIAPAPVAPASIALPGQRAPAPEPALPPAGTNATRNAVLLVAAVLLAGFAALVIAILLFARLSPTAPPIGARPADTPPRDPCTSTCTRLAECTGISDPQCETNCKHSPTLASCGAREGCEAISSCALGAACSGKVPQGTMSCRATADCEWQCLTRAGGDPAACMCACAHLMAPDRANELAANNLCGQLRCGDACRKPVNAATCLRCFETSCLSESLACKGR
jgi:serine/threonine-protein kinase